MSFTYGQKARELLLELKQGDWLPPYGVRARPRARLWL